MIISNEKNMINMDEYERAIKHQHEPIYIT